MDTGCRGIDRRLLPAVAQHLKPAGGSAALLRWTGGSPGKGGVDACGGRARVAWAEQGGKGRSSTSAWRHEGYSASTPPSQDRRTAGRGACPSELRFEFTSTHLKWSARHAARKEGTVK